MQNADIQLAHAKSEGMSSAIVLLLGLLGQLAHYVNVIGGLIITVTGAILGVHAVWRLIQRGKCPK